MPTLDELINRKIETLESVPAQFETNIMKVEKQLLKEVEGILALFDMDSDGFFIPNEKNVELLGQLDIKLREALNNSDYAEAITEFAKQFNVQVTLNDDYFKAAFAEFEESAIGRQIVKQAQKNAVNILVNTVAQSEFVSPITQQLENAVVNGARWKETMKVIEDYIIGYKDERGNFKQGKLSAHSKQIAHDTFAVTDRSYAATVANEIGAEWFRYSGGTIKTSRVFCIERHNRYFSRGEIELWGDGVKTGRQGEFDTPQAGTWAGEMLGTDRNTIFSTAGGYNCGHSIMAVSIATVPKKDITRAISLGYFKPSEFEIEQLGLDVN